MSAPNNSIPKPLLCLERSVINQILHPKLLPAILHSLLRWSQLPRLFQHAQPPLYTPESPYMTVANTVKATPGAAKVARDTSNGELIFEYSTYHILPRDFAYEEPAQDDWSLWINDPIDYMHLPVLHVRALHPSFHRYCRHLPPPTYHRRNLI